MTYPWLTLVENNKYAQIQVETIFPVPYVLCVFQISLKPTLSWNSGIIY